MDFKRLYENSTVDIENISKIILSCGQDMYKRKNLTHWKNGYDTARISADIKEKELYIVYEQDIPVATFALSETPSKYFEADKKAIYISKFAVMPDKSGGGLGSRCLDFIEKTANARKITTLRLDVYDKSEDAIRFYVNRGFKTLKSEPTRLFNVLCMEKSL